ncbi:uncharacterized protein DEA37_0002460 [Paragonimus westermani]|uniref:RRM domain-containing protein n=2 Tax=Paragonimus westermani TaxID=34504 RepID=A0A5J4NFB5_9TREM|nr:uncharacterized protein DEA37_0002460 [Paragonimus westermani]
MIQRTTIKSNEFASRTVGVRILSSLTGSDEVYFCQSPLTLPRSNSPTGVSIVGNSRRTAQNGDSVVGISTSEHSHFISRPIPIKQSVQQNPTQVPIKLDYGAYVDYPQRTGYNIHGKELHPNVNSFNPISHSLLDLHSNLTQSARALQRPEEQASDSGRGGSEEEEQSSHPAPQSIRACRGGVEVDSEQEPTEHRCTHYMNLQGNIVDCGIVTCKETGESRGFGFVTFDYYDPVDKAILYKPHHIGNSRADVKKTLSKEQINETKRKRVGRYESSSNGYGQQSHGYDQGYGSDYGGGYMPVGAYGGGYGSGGSGYS